MQQIKKVFKIILSKIIGFIFFLVLILAANLLANYIQNPIFTNTITTINSSIWIIITMSLLFLIAEIFWALDFPFNLPAPLFSAISSLFLISFIIQLLKFIGLMSNFLTLLSWIAYPFVFSIILIWGLIKILLDHKHSKKNKKKHKK